MATTREKIEMLVTELRQMPIESCDGKTRDLVELMQIMQGIAPKLDPLTLLIPADDSEADDQIDSLIALLLQVRGDDLPPFDFERHLRDVAPADASD